MRKIKNYKELLKVYGLSAILTLAAFYAAYQFVGPAPTRNIVIATGGKDGAYYQFGLKYADRFKKAGVELKVLESAGSVDNLTRLMEDGENIHAALIQGGVGMVEAFPIIESLGSLYYEPLWLFHTRNLNIESLGDLAAKRIVVGHQGSGTYALAAQLLADNGITPQTSQYLKLGGNEGIQALVAGQADALFVVAGTRSGAVLDLLENPQVVPYSFHRAAAYVRNFKFLSEVMLPMGSVNLKRNIPDKDIVLVAPAANLVVRKDLHPALMYLFLMAAEQVHMQGGLLEERGAFPSPKAIGFPLNKEAKRFYQSGPPFLMRVLPFRLATWLVRMFVMAIPLITIIYPLMKIAPPTYNWRVRRKLHKLYKKLYRIELDSLDTSDRKDIERLCDRLEKLNQSALSVHVPASFLYLQYTLRRHISLVREGLEAAIGICQEKQRRS